MSTKNILPVLALCGVLPVMVTSSAEHARASRQDLPVRLVDLPLNRAVWGTLTITPGVPLLGQVSSAGGFALTQIMGIPQHAASYFVGVNQNLQQVRLRLSVNSVIVASLLLTDGVRDRFEFNPPIVLRPGDALGVEFVPLDPYGSASGFPFPAPQVGNDLPELTVGGWLLLPGEI